MKKCKCETNRENRREVTRKGFLFVVMTVLAYAFFVVGGMFSAVGWVSDGAESYLALFVGYGCFGAMVFCFQSIIFLRKNEN